MTNRLPQILLIEDDKYFAHRVIGLLKTIAQIVHCPNPEEAKKILITEKFDLLISDLHLGDGVYSFELIELAKNKGLQLIVLSSTEDEGEIRQAYGRGADQVLTKNNVQNYLPKIIQSYLHKKNIMEVFDRFPTKHQPLINSIKNIISINWFDRSLLITGPTGSGKSYLGKIIAETISDESSPFIHLNCSEISESLIESELFGHEKGSFTGAYSKKLGKLKLADGGTLFLDEIGTMSTNMQQKLLKAIEEKTFYPVGSNQPEKSNFRLISASCEDLNQKINLGNFREDLYYRLSGLKLDLPSLNNRPDDIPFYLQHFQKTSPKKIIFENEAIEYLKNYPWRGNIRELKQKYFQIIDSGHGLISLNLIKNILQSPDSNPSWDNKSGFLSQRNFQIIEEKGLNYFIKQIEKEVITENLKKHSGRISYCIKDLKISSSAFYRIMQEVNSR